MSIKLNDNIKINAGKPSEAKYLSTGNTAYVSISEVNTQIPIAERHIGLTVLINSGGTNLEYWYKTDVTNTDLVEKKFSSEQLVGDFITGATNLGYFSGQTGLQTLQIVTSNNTFNGNYYSIYNYYYRDSDGIINLGRPTYNEPFRRAYIATISGLKKSWVWDVSIQGWGFINGDVSENVGNLLSMGYNYGPTYYTVDEWSETGGDGSGFYNGGTLASVSVEGSLTTGDTITIGNPIYRDKYNQDLNLRSIITDTPKFINVTTDDNFIRISGSSSVLTATNYGGGIGVYSGQSNNNLQFRTLVSSGDTSIVQQTDGKIVIYSSSNGSADAITGVTNVGSGIGIYSGTTTGRTVQLKSLIGSGGTTVTDSGNTIIINSTGGSGTVFSDNITVSIANGKTFGRYENGDIIPASGKTPNEVILMSLAEPLAPTVNLSSPISDVRFGLSTKTVSLNFSYVINTASASVVSAVLEWNRGGGAWAVLDSNTGHTSYYHSINDSANRFNTDDINYRYTVIDSEGASGQTTILVTPIGYLTPDIGAIYSAFNLIPAYESYSLREVGNVDTNIGGTINARSLLVNIVSYEVQRNDGSGYVTIASETGFSTTSKPITAYLDTGAASDARTINYRIVVVDEYQSTTGGASVINLDYASYFGYSTNTSLSGAQIVALGNKALLSSVNRTIASATAGEFEYTYISYPATFNDISLIMQNDNITIQTATSGAFTKLSNVTVNNYYTESISNKVYKSNAPNAFTDDKLDIS